LTDAGLQQYDAIWDEALAKPLSTLGTHREVERVFKIGRRFAHAKFLLLKDEAWLIVSIEAESNAEPYWPG
jgi:hypothetical protein